MRVRQTLLIVLASVISIWFIWMTATGWNRPIAEPFARGLGTGYWNMLSLTFCISAIALVWVAAVLYPVIHQMREPIGQLDRHGKLVLSVYLCQKCGKITRSAGNCPKCHGPTHKTKFGILTSGPTPNQDE